MECQSGASTKSTNGSAVSGRKRQKPSLRLLPQRTSWRVFTSVDKTNHDEWEYMLQSTNIPSYCKRIMLREQEMATCSSEAGSRKRSHKRSLATLGTSRLNLKPFVWCSLSVGTMIDDTADYIILLLICIQHVISSNFGIPFACMAIGVFA